MRRLRILPVLLASIAIAGLGVRAASAASMTYDLIPGSGQVTAVYLGTDQTNSVLDAPVAIDVASLTANFDPLNAQLDNLFIAVDGPGQINLGTNGSVTFSDATLQSTAGALAPGGTPGSYVYNALADIRYSLDGGISFNTLASSPGGTIEVDGDGLKIFVDNVGLGFMPDGTQINANFAFNARRVDGSTTAIPEPGSQLLFPAGLALLGWALRLRKDVTR